MNTPTRILVVDDVAIFLVDDPAAYLARPRELSVVGVELLV